MYESTCNQKDSDDRVAYFVIFFYSDDKAFSLHMSLSIHLLVRRDDPTFERMMAEFVVTTPDWSPLRIFRMTRSGDMDPFTD